MGVLHIFVSKASLGCRNINTRIEITDWKTAKTSLPPCSGRLQDWQRGGEHPWDRRRRHPEVAAGTPTLEAATSWAVLAAISWEQTISSSYFPVCRTTLSADSLQRGSKGDWVTDTAEQVQIIYLLLIPLEISSWIQQLCNYRIMELLVGKDL